MAIIDTLVRRPDDTPEGPDQAGQTMRAMMLMIAIEPRK